ncbi:ABC transporter ATP-binding protein [Planosporangium thailandense]|uniref:ABC transporter ATP-binding protein n=1 Tax=Planosporangium thailandense TaxID=765197 RepID=A0ABX0Y036_9ACTN|nr:ABC transporter ATP-binding protein [Planosporangium thailandense]NJC71426.1 ABC transporter ATP-binding protein [Planosporangium thailandense]
MKAQTTRAADASLPAGSAADIVIDNVSMSFPTQDGTVVRAIDHVNEKVDAGRFVAIVGPSGCGKSTLLSLIAGLQTPTSGEVRIGGEVVRSPKRTTGVVFQEDSTLPWKTVLDNVCFGMRVAGVPKREQLERAQQFITLVGLQGFEKAHPPQLSGGMRQRVAIARTLALNPNALLMDEPFGALDQQTRLLIGAEVRRIWRETHKTVVFVTHDIQEAILLSQEVWVMSYRPGRILDRVVIDLPENRDTSSVGTPEFSEVFNHIWGLVRGEAMQAFADSEHAGLAGNHG